MYSANEQCMQKIMSQSGQE